MHHSVYWPRTSDMLSAPFLYRTGQGRPFWIGNPFELQTEISSLALVWLKVKSDAGAGGGKGGCGGLGAWRCGGGGGDLGGG